MSASQVNAWYLTDDETGRLIGSYNWASTSLGAIAEWPFALQNFLCLALTAEFPVILWLSSDYILVFNNALRTILGNQITTSLGLPCKEVFPEGWAWMKPILERVTSTGKGTSSKDWFCPVMRDGYLEESYWSIAHTPLLSPEHKVLGIISGLHPCTERVVGERRLLTLRNLSMHMANAIHYTEACNLAAEVLAENALDVPSALLYLPEQDMRALSLVHSVRFPPEAESLVHAPGSALSRSISGVCSTGESQLVDLPQAIRDLLPATTCREYTLDKPRAALLMPLESTVNRQRKGVLLVALNPGCASSEAYTTFLTLVASQITAALRVAAEREAEKRRTAELTALDKSKTDFFSNISHEFRTPLMMMLGPLEELLLHCNDRTADASLIAFREQFVLMQRNGERLLKLVDSLLNFSRIESGHMQGRYQPLELDTVTTNLANFFRAECEKANLELVVKCNRPREPVYVDLEMWEKIVTNLLSNAIKFTTNGCIEVVLDEAPDCSGVELCVRDTGCGISPAEIPHAFERFRRIGTRKDMPEGTGIGLALISELVHMQGGSVRVQSEEGRGSNFIVSLPYGTAHLPPEQLLEEKRGSLSRHTSRSELLTELPSARSEPTEDVSVGSSSSLLSAKSVVSTPGLERGNSGECSPSLVVAADSTSSVTSDGFGSPVLASTSSSSSLHARVMVIDKNTDMRYYLRRLLTLHQYFVLEARDGEEALALLRSLPEEELPEMVLSDVIMPRLDGFGLLQAVRSEERQVLRHIPILLISARAGEEASSNGIVAGADDYLVKPFSAKELLARISGRLEVARFRRAAAKNEQKLREEAERANAAKDRFLAVLSHELRTPLTPTLLLAETMAADESLSESVREDANFIARNVRLEAELINDLLDVTKIREHKLELNRQRISVHAVLTQALQLLQPSVQEKYITVDLYQQATREVVVGDAARLQQVFWNLLGNSVKFTPCKGRITVQSCDTSDGCISVSITDTGKGIAPDLLPRLFNAFEQGGSSVTRSFGGLGLGLCISKALVLMHGGWLVVRSEGEGKGASVIVTLPLASPGSVASPNVPCEPIARAVRMQHTLNVMIVEDNEATITILERLLQRLGHTWQTARTVHDALELCKATSTDPFDALLCDVGLPDASGLEVVREMTKRQPLCYCVTLSGYGTAADVQSSLEAGAAQHLTKPVRFAELTDALRHVTSRKGSLHPC